MSEFNKFCKKYYKQYLDLCKLLDRYFYTRIINSNSCEIYLNNNWIVGLNLDYDNKYLTGLQSDRGHYYSDYEEINLYYLLENIFYDIIELNEKSQKFLNNFQNEFIIILNKIIIQNSDSSFINNTYFDKTPILPENCKLKGTYLLSDISIHVIYIRDETRTIYVSDKINMNSILKRGKELWEKEIEEKS